MTVFINQPRLERHLVVGPGFFILVCIIQKSSGVVHLIGYLESELDKKIKHKEIKQSKNTINT